MTATELTVFLQTVPPDMPVFRDDHEWGPRSVKRASVEKPAPPIFFQGVSDYPALAVVIR